MFVSQQKQPSEGLNERLQEALQALKLLTPEDVLAGRRQWMSLRLFTNTFDISRTSIKKYPQLYEQVLFAITDWNDDFGLCFESKKYAIKPNRVDELESKILNLEEELSLAQGAQFEAWQERMRSEDELKKVVAELNQLKQVGRFPPVVEGFSPRYAKRVPLWFQFEVLRLYPSEHESIMAKIEQYKKRYASALPGGADGFYALFVRPDAAFVGFSLLESMGQQEEVEALLKARCL
ncbi:MULTISPECIES: hypothetical protein [Vibrio]|uniref:Uncharacterized protein n=1 Tax=Vibrio splendidus TaxID=29497 RepID=A0AB35N333_VIBSP|nr:MULTISPECIES: hypothetical protein [Vibrio]MCF7504761.1 hypothetical protein [Vibrio sp. L3-7]MDP2503261.1 hypothetical protein [Vibrio splendidus]